MIKINSIEDSDGLMSVDVEIALCDGTSLHVDVALSIDYIDDKECIILPLMMGGCLGIDPEDPSTLHYHTRQDLEGNSLDQVIYLYQRDLIYIRREPGDWEIVEWGFKNTLDFPFHLKPDFEPTKQNMTDLIQQLVEKILPEKLIRKEVK